MPAFTLGTASQAPPDATPQRGPIEHAATTDMLVAECAIRPGARPRRRPDAENDDGEVSFLNLPLAPHHSDHLVGEREQPVRNLEAEGLGSLEVDYQLIFRRLLHVSGTDREP